MTEIITTAKGKKQTLEIEEQPFTLLVAQQGIKIDVPEAVLEIDGMKTLQCIQSLTQKDWAYVSTSPMFIHMFNIVFPHEQKNNKGTPMFEAVEIPKTIEELLDADYGVQHVCGMIILIGEAVFKAQDDNRKIKIFIRNPETHLHPSTERTIVGMFKAFLGETIINDDS